MSEQLPPSNAGFADEDSHESIAAEPAQRPVPKPSKSEEMKKNIKAVFGHGVGKVSLIVVGVVLVGGLALGISGLTKGDKAANGKLSQVDAPRAPEPEVSVQPISEAEAQRRAERSALEAQQAAQKGQSYQAGFDPNIVANSGDRGATGNGTFNVPGQPFNNADMSQSPEIRVGAGQPSTNQTTADVQNGAQGNAKNNSDAAAQERARIDAEYKAAVAARDKYVEDMRSRILKQAEDMMGASESSKGFAVKSSFSNVNYYTLDKRTVDEKGNVALAKAEAAKDPNAIETVGDKGRPLLIKTGKIMYATLDSEINTDDGGEVLATVQGGAWSGSKLIGKIEQGPNNIRAKFTIMAPQDDRQTMRINAVALREDDAKQGIAEEIDSHTAERYFALGAASLLTGYGRSYQQTAGTTVISPSGVVAQTTTEPSTKQVIGTSVGELGSAIGSEVRRGFNRPTTYSTPANKGFGLFFLQDVHEQSR